MSFSSDGFEPCSMMLGLNDVVPRSADTISRFIVSYKGDSDIVRSMVIDR